MQWRKLGLVLKPDNHYPWMQTHAANPMPVSIGNNFYKIYFSTRNLNQHSSIGWVIIDINNPCKIIDMAKSPLLSPGEKGLFDDCGISMGCIVSTEVEDYLYYMGWNLGVNAPWYNTIGMAISKREKDKFNKLSFAPIINRSHIDPFSLSYPWVLKIDNKWQMWYGSCLTWMEKNKNMHIIKYAESNDGINWQCNGDIAIALASANEIAISRPCVLYENNLYRMWYSCLTTSYRIGYAESLDGKIWQRQDQRVGIDCSVSGWDSEMLCYPSVFKHKNDYFMLYCGNRYGKEGFGIAILESSLSS